MGGGATTKKMPLLNRLAVTYGYESAIMVVHGVSEHLASEGKQDSSQILDMFHKEIDNLYPEKDTFDLYIADGVVAVQVAGTIMGV